MRHIFVDSLERHILDANSNRICNHLLWSRKGQSLDLKSDIELFGPLYSLSEYKFEIYVKNRIISQIIIFENGILIKISKSSRSSHGKSPIDGIGGTAKTIAYHAAMRGARIKNAEELHNFLVTKNTQITSKFIREEVYDTAKRS